MLFHAIFTQEVVQNYIVELNTEGQLKFGILSDGDILPNYSEVSQDLFGKEDIPIQLFDTGAFWKSFDVFNVTNTEFFIDADDEKTDENGDTTYLFERYGEDVAGLTPKSIELLTKFVIPKIQQYVIAKILQ